MNPGHSSLLHYRACERKDLPVGEWKWLSCAEVIVFTGVGCRQEAMQDFAGRLITYAWFYAILCKGLELSWIWVSEESSKSNQVDTKG